MTELVPPTEIEGIVGAKRHPRVHIGRAVSAEQTVYILHSQRCLDIFADLRKCRFSLALDRGIDAGGAWAGQQDKAVFLGVWDGRLVPIRDVE